MKAHEVLTEWRELDRRALLHAKSCELDIKAVDLGNPYASYSQLTVASLDGVPICVRAIVPTDGGPHPTVLMFHDATRDIRGWHHMTRFVALGYAVLALQNRPGVNGVLVKEPLVVGDGLGVAMRVSGEEPPRLGRKLDAQTMHVLRSTYVDALVLAHAAGRVEGIDANRLVTWGEGFGAGVALAVASIVGACGACALNPMPSALDESCAALDVACIAQGYAAPVLLGTCMLDLQATPEAQDVVCAGLERVRRKRYPRYGHERVNAFEDEMVSFLVELSAGSS